MYSISHPKSLPRHKPVNGNSRKMTAAKDYMRADKYEDSHMKPPT